ncbi:GvpL/GvpF family gas vesicle protein [Nocardia takedensis]
MTPHDDVWLYAVGSVREQGEVPSELTGVADEHPRVLDAEGLRAVVGSVPAEVFGERSLPARFEDMRWLEATARAHDAVVSALARRAAVVPLRLATLFHDDQGVLTLLRERRADFETALDLVRGRTEWGVRAYGDRARLIAAAAETREDGVPATPGAAYLARRRAQLSARESVEREAEQRAERIHRRLLEKVAAGRRQPPTDPAVSGRRDWMLLNGTYLVDDERAGRFADTVAALEVEHPGIRLELSGPWPPYSFADSRRDTS